MCHSGFEPDPSFRIRPNVYRRCKDINECVVDSDRCDHHCYNKQGSYTCSCRTGYRLLGDGRSCQDINECLVNNGGCAHDCDNTPGSYNCDCNRGYDLLADRHGCIDIKECQRGLHNCMQKCNELEGGFSCECYTGYKLQSDKASCRDIDECRLSISRCQQRCMNTIGSYTCDCETGFKLLGDGFLCQDIDECRQNNGGCNQICNNTNGSYKCKCEEGYRLESNGFNCTALPCPTLMKLRNGEYMCNGDQVTGTVCNFKCEHGYRLVGSDERQCLRTSMWSGNVTSCQILHCNELSNPENGSVLLPCPTRLNTTCRILCSPGFYSLTQNIVQRCEVNDENVAIWSEVPECFERKACFPNPCQHGGKCMETIDSFACDCDGTGHTGTNCNVLLINTPDISSLILNTPTSVLFSAQADRQVELMIIPDDKNALDIVPSNVQFSQHLTQQNVIITVKKPGLYKITYSIPDDSVNYQPIPSVQILVFNNEMNNSNYFDKHEVIPGLLQPGCCKGSADNLKLEFRCPPSDTELTFMTTCGWVTKGDVHSAGIIFSNYTDYYMPIAIAGARLLSQSTYIDVQTLTTFEFNFGCITCRGGSVGNVFGPPDPCGIEKVTVNDVHSFLKYDSLAFTYLHHSMDLIPNWLRFKILHSNHTYDANSYMVRLRHHDSLEMVKECNNLFPLSRGLYSVMIYSGQLRVYLNEESKKIKSTEFPMCFSVNLCEGASSPLYITLSSKAQKAIDSFEFMRDLKEKSWDIVISSLAISNNKINTEPDKAFHYSYWNGTHYFSVNLQKPNIISSVKIHKIFYMDESITAKLDFVGRIQWLYENVNEIFTEQSRLSWSGYLAGSIKLNISIPVLGEVSSLLLLNDSNPSLVLSGDIDTTMRCHGCPNPMGFALKLVYHIDSKSTGLFSTLLIVPPKEEFGLRTQFSCPLDGFTFINDDHNMEAISIVSSCLGLRLGSFPIVGLEIYIYIFNECKVSPFCSTTKSTNANMIIWSKFPESLLKLPLGNFIELFPASESNQTGFVLTMSKNLSVLNAELFNVRIALFDVLFNCMANINEKKLEFSSTVKLFDKHPTQLRGSIKQTTDWNSAPIEVHGRFLDTSGNLPDLLCKQIHKRIVVLYTRSQLRVKNAESVYDRARSQHSTVEMTFSEREGAKNDSDNLVRQTEQELDRMKNTVQSISAELEEANDEIRNLMDSINELCTLRECPEVCIPQQVCETCQRDVSTTVQGTCTVACTKKVTVTVVVRTEVRFRWQFVPTRICHSTCTCTGFRCLTSTNCRTVSICKRVAYNYPVTGSRVVDSPSVCMKPCSEVAVQAPVTAQCCGSVGCSNQRQEEDVNCLSENQECEQARNSVYENLADEQSNATRLFQSLDVARANVRVTSLRLMRYRARYSLTERQFNESEVAYDEARTNLEIATTSLNEVKRELQLDLLEKVRNGSICGNATPYIKIKSVSFNSIVMTESPTVLPVDVEVFIPSTSKTVTKTVVIDFLRFNMSLQQAASAITEKVILNRKYLSKRFSRNVVNGSETDQNQLHFQSRCTDIQNILSYLKNLNRSIFIVAATAISSMENVDDSNDEISNLIASSSLAFKREMNVDFQKIANVTNKDIDDVRNFAGYINGSEEANELLKLMQEYLSNGQELINSLDLNLFWSWQSKMEYLHNQTKSAAGFSCFGFSGCLQEVVEMLSELVDSVPSNTGPILSMLPSAAKDLLDLALLQNYSITSAVANTENIYRIANDPMLSNYWCADPPKLTVQPVKRINPRENTTIELSCEVEVEEYTNYQWKKDCVQIPNQKSSALVLTNVKLSDSGNYTCVVTNQVSSVTSTNASVEVQQFPSFFLQPKNIDEYLGNWNGAVFESNATGFPYPGFRWYFRPKGTSEYTQIPGEDQNELVIVPPLPENEGSYYCEAFNEQGTLRSRIVNLTVLESTVVQVAQTAQINFTNFDSELDILSIGSGVDETSSDVNITLTPATIISLQNSLTTMLNALISFGSTSLENITIYAASSNIVTTSFTLYSENISYPETPLTEVNQLAPQARVEWLPVWQRLQEVLGTSEFTITDGEKEYKSDPSSLQFGALQFVCPPGKEVSSVNNFLCVSCPLGSYQVLTSERLVNDDGRVTQFVAPKCIECPIGYYQDEQGQPRCKKCPPGYSTITTGVRQPNDFVKQCPPGMFSRTGVEPCIKCPRGTYATTNGSTFCFNCYEKSKESLCPQCQKCHHICYENNSTCACHDGYILSENGYSCIKCASLQNTADGTIENIILIPTWHVVLCNNLNAFVCSGSLVGDEWIVTSAKCVCGNSINESLLSVRVKKSHTCVIEETGEIDLPIAEIYCHPDYNKPYHEMVDLALIKTGLSIPPQELSNALPLCLQNNSLNQLYDYGQSGQLFTYGLGNPAKIFDDDDAELAGAVILLSPYHSCYQQFYEDGIDYKTSRKMFCTRLDTASSCAASPGSALISVESNGKVTFAGVISTFTEMCGTHNSFSANTKVQDTAVHKWIKDTISNN